jgi:hypothetical protein
LEAGLYRSPRPRRTKPGGQERGAAKRNKWRGPTKWGGGRLCRIRVTLDRSARRGLFPRGECPALGTRRHPRQDRKALRKPGFPSDSEFRNIPSCRWRPSPILAFHRGELGILKRGEKGQECIICPITADRGIRWCDPLQRPFLDAKRELRPLA